MNTSRVALLLARLWWVLVPPFAVLVVRLMYERACRSPYELLGNIMSNSIYAWPLAILYLGVHCWAAAAYVITVERSGTLAPAVAGWRIVWGRDWPKILLTALVIVVEYWPVQFWRIVGRTVLGCIANG
jgi:hypothetical protein